ncbi:MAG: pantoate--beta-alanine ligase [Flavobacteriales bacterium]|nr:pantoate--beta-alanine ligase [Flavobacteriales bacterium]|tara:strand:- start:442 stop:1287 length:846 start_codon:yes stop_codon:yes gene_type:complete
MLLVKNIDTLEKCLGEWKSLGLSVGFVPTMGALHLGHLSLIEQAISENDKVVCSIFVNPTQFTDPKDLENYPIQIEEDLVLLKKVGCDLVFTPTKTDMYPQGEEVVQFNINDLDYLMEGAHRQGHFDGVCTIVSKLFELVRPKNAYFGQKDFQQLIIIRQLNKIQKFNINIVGCPIIREDNGLAMSSRNVLLSSREREIAAEIYRILKETKAKFPNSSVESLKLFVETKLNAVSEFSVDYVEIAHAQTLQSLSDLEKNEPAILCVAVFVGSVRLIDNILLN